MASKTLVSTTLLIALAMALLLAGCAPLAIQAHPAITNAPQTQTELVHADVLGAGLSSANITVLGVRVGKQR